MKQLFLILVFLIFSASAQSQTRFVRIIDKQGNKIAKGKITTVEDTSIVITKGGREARIAISKINFIITCRSAGHNILIGTLSGGLLGMMAGGNSGGDDVFNEEQSMFIGLAAGAGIGMLLSVLTLPIKPTEYIYVNGDRAIIEKFVKQ